MRLAERLHIEYEALNADLDRLFENVPEEQARRLPGPNRWSMIDCIAHLNSTALPYIDRIEAQLRDTGTADQGKDLRLTLFGRLFTGLMEPPARMKSKTMKEYEPQHSGSVEETLAEFRRLHARLAELCREIDHGAARRDRIPSPVVSWLRLPAADWLAFLAAHARRHLSQAGRARG